MKSGPMTLKNLPTSIKYFQDKYQISDDYLEMALGGEFNDHDFQLDLSQLQFIYALAFSQNNLLDIKLMNQEGINLALRFCAARHNQVNLVQLMEQKPHDFSSGSLVSTLNILVLSQQFEPIPLVYQHLSNQMKQLYLGVALFNAVCTDSEMAVKHLMSLTPFKVSNSDARKCLEVAREKGQHSILALLDEDKLFSNQGLYYVYDGQPNTGQSIKENDLIHSKTIGFTKY